jgi:rubredoxin
MTGKWITVATYSQPVQAHLARTQLESEGIRCVVGDEHLVRVDWLLSNAIGGVKLKVHSTDAEHAREVLRPKPRLVVVAEPGTSRYGGVEDDDLICPRCRSFDVYFHRFDKRIAGVFWLAFGFIVPWLARKWECKQCGYSWRERR